MNKDVELIKGYLDELERELLEVWQGVVRERMSNHLRDKVYKSMDALSVVKMLVNEMEDCKDE